jgi:hypothetical protein
VRVLEIVGLWLALDVVILAAWAQFRRTGPPLLAGDYVLEPVPTDAEWRGLGHPLASDPATPVVAPP